jgi:hypothetical protein
MYPFTQCLLNIEGHMRLLWVSDAAWLADPSAHATAALHLLSAIQQYTSGMLQHVLPRLFKSGSRAANKLMHTLQEQTATVHAIAATLTDAIYHAALTDTSTSGALSPQLQRLMLSPPFMACVAADLALKAFQVQTCLELSRGGGQLPDPAGSRSSSNSGTADDKGRCTQGQQGAASSKGSSSSNSSGGSGAMLASSYDCLDRFSPCQLELCEVLGVDARTFLWGSGGSSLPSSLRDLLLVVEVYRSSYCFVLDNRTHPVQHQQQLLMLVQDQQRVHREGQCHMLLKVFMMRCAAELAQAISSGRHAQREHHSLLCLLLGQCLEAGDWHWWRVLLDSAKSSKQGFQAGCSQGHQAQQQQQQQEQQAGCRQGHQAQQQQRQQQEATGWLQTTGPGAAAAGGRCLAAASGPGPLGD